METHDADDTNRKIIGFLRVIKLAFSSTLLFLSACSAVEATPIVSHSPPMPVAQSEVITEDLARFWQAYDAVMSAPSREERIALMNRLYVDRGTPGLHALMRARRYSSAELVDAIMAHPRYFTAMRGRMSKVEASRMALQDGIERFNALYPAMRPYPIYIAIGALRTGGTAIDQKLLIGAELAFADPQVPVDEFGENLAHLPTYFATDPSASVVDLTVHEYVHSQQNVTGGYDLLSQALFEGVAEFVATKAMGKPSPTPAIDFGTANDARVRAAFEQDMFGTDYSNWIWNSDDNEFGMRDLGYYVGYAIAQRYVARAANEKAAIAELIELDYASRLQVEALVDRSGWFTRPVAEIRSDQASQSTPAPAPARPRAE